MEYRRPGGRECLELPVGRSPRRSYEVQGEEKLNLIVLCQKSVTCSMERMEKAAHYGLIALAVSDLLVCLVVLVNVFYETGRHWNGGTFAHDSFDCRLAYRLYGNGVINTFMLSSTWLIVTMAVSRYIAICHPLSARQIIGKRFTVMTLVLTTIGSVLFNVPRFFLREPRSIEAGGRRFYFAFAGPMQRHPGVQLAYSWSYFTLGIAVPLGALAFCNAKLFAALRRSKQLRAQTASAAVRQPSDSASVDRITVTLIAITVLFVVLFVPAELLNFFIEHATQDVYQTDVFNVAQAVGNLLQAINFAVNFVLYCVANTHFRRTICRLVDCSHCRHADSSVAEDIPMITECDRNGLRADSYINRLHWISARSGSTML